MSLKIMLSVFSLEISSTEKLVLIALGDHAHHDGTGAYPSVELLMTKTSLSRRGVQTVLRRLEKLNLIAPIGTVAGGRGETVEYKITLPARKSAFGTRLRPAKGRTPPPKRAHVATKKGAYAAPESSLTCKEPAADGRAVGLFDGFEPDLPPNENVRICHRHLPDALKSDDDEKTASPSKVRVQDHDENLTSEQLCDRRYSDRLDAYREQILPKFIAAGYDRIFLNLALDEVDQRAWDCKTRIASPAYFATALSNLLHDPKAVARLKEMCSQGRRSYVDMDLTDPALPEASERARELFNSQVRLGA